MQSRHSRTSGNLGRCQERWPWVPAFAGMTKRLYVNFCDKILAELVADWLTPEPVAPPLDVPDRGRGKMHRAAQRVPIAVAFEKAAPG